MYRDEGGIWHGERLNHPMDREAEREYQAEQLEGFFERSGLFETFSSDRTQAERFDSFFSVDNQQLAGYLTRVNGILRNIPTGVRGFAEELQFIGKIDEHEPRVHFIPCFYEDKETLLFELFDSARKLKSPQEAATLLGFGINIVHPFSDGNGRIARLVYTSILHGFNPDNDTLRDIIGESGEELLELSGDYYVDPVFNLLKIDSPSFSTNIVNGVVRGSYSKVVPAVFDGSKPIFTDKDDPENPDTKKRMQLFSILFDRNMKDFVSAGAKRDADNGQLDVAKERIINNVNGVDYFLLDRFLKEGSDADIERAFSLIRRMAKLFTRRFFREFTAPYNQQLAIGLCTKEFGIMSLRFAEYGSHIAEKVVTPIELPAHLR